MILMNGHIDKASEMFSLDNFKKLIDYANEKNLGRVSFWALNRDRPCGSNIKDRVSGVCSSVAQQPYDYSKILAEFKPSSVALTPSSIPPSTPTSTPPSTPPSTHRSTPHSTSPPTPTDKPNSNSSPTPTTQPVTHAIIHSTVIPTEPIVTDVDCTNEPENKFFPYKDDCHKYVRCYNKLAHLATCPVGTIYDNKLHISVIFPQLSKDPNVIKYNKFLFLFI
jgi:hypothetical protein